VKYIGSLALLLACSSCMYVVKVYDVWYTSGDAWLNAKVSIVYSIVLVFYSDVACCNSTCVVCVPVAFTNGHCLKVAHSRRKSRHSMSL